MDMRRFAASYCRSPLGIVSFFAAAGAGAAALLLGRGPVPALLLALGCLAAIVLASLALGAGQRAAAAESERELAERARGRLAEAASARARLAALRLADVELSRARDLVVLEAGRLVEDCGRAGSYDPESVQAVLDSLSIVDAWQRESDESSTEARFDLADAHPLPDASSRAASALREKAALIAKGRERASGEIPGADRIAIEEELK